MLKYSLKFSLKNKTPEPQLVRARLSFHSQRIELYTGVKATIDEFDGVRIKKRSDERNKRLSELERKVESIFTDFEYLHKRYPTKDEFKNLFNQGKENLSIPENDLTFVDLIDKYMAEKSESKQWERNTIKNYTRLRNNLSYFNNSIKLNNVTEKTLRDLTKYFLTNPKDKHGNPKKPHVNFTVKREINDYKRILAWGEKKGYYNGSAHKEHEQIFKGTSERLSELVYLEWEELMELYSYQFNSDRLSRVRDVFCFCCFSSLRYSDVAKLKKTDIRKDSIIVATKKTTDPLIIDLNQYSEAILKKYENVELENNLALPVISDQKTNKYLKEIGEIMNWDSPIKIHHFIGNKSVEEYVLKKNVISTHAARRTFVISALRLGIPVEVIIKWTGHKDYEAMKPYVKIVDELKKSQMNKFNLAPNLPPK